MAAAIFRADRVRVELGDTGRSAGLNLTLDPGEPVRLGGPSGAGKTTMLKALARLRPISEGRIYLGRRPYSEIDPTAWRRRVAYLAQQPAMVDGSLVDNLALPFKFKTAGGRGYDPARANELLDRLRLSGLDPGGPAGSLSGGEKARLALVRALLTEPEVILADELLAHLDETTRQPVVELLTEYLVERGAGLVVVTHDPSSWPGGLREVALDTA